MVVAGGPCRRYANIALVVRHLLLWIAWRGPRGGRCTSWRALCRQQSMAAGALLGLLILDTCWWPHKKKQGHCCIQELDQPCCVSCAGAASSAAQAMGLAWYERHCDDATVAALVSREFSLHASGPMPLLPGGIAELLQSGRPTGKPAAQETAVM